MRMNSLSFLGLASLLAAACSAPSNVETDEVVSSESDLSASGIGEACSAPVRSADGLYALVDLCPAHGQAGRLLRIDLATNAMTDVVTYPATDRVENLSESGGSFVFDVLHEVDAAGEATRGIDVHVHDWALAGGRTITTAALAGVAGDFHRLAVLRLTDDGASVFYAASGAGGQGGDAELARRLLVAPASGTDAPVAVDLGEGANADNIRFSTSGDSIVGHELALDASNAIGEKLHLVESRGASGPRLVGSRRAAFASPVMTEAAGAPGQAKKKKARAWDGSRAWGLREGANETNDLVSFDPRSGSEKVLESALGLRIITSIGGDVIYTTRADVATGSEVTLKRIPAAGGTPTVLAQATVPTRDHAKVAFDLVALGASGTYGIFRSIVPTSTPSTWAPFERWLVKLDGSAPAVQLSGQGASFSAIDNALGDRFLYLEAHSNGQAGRKTVDLRTGEVSSAGVMPSYAQSILVGDGSILEVETCQGGTFSEPWRQLRHITRTGEVVGTCGRNNWSTSSLTIEGSPVVVFFSELPTATGVRYPVAVVKP